ncbi:MAG: putative RND superfamily exporter protein [Myxococcota bacterium]|jgi:predicted RND superfamily exporter protein
MRHRWVAAGLMIAATAVLGVFAARVGINNAVDVWFVEGDPSLASYHRFQSTFGNDEVVAVAVTAAEGTVWNAPTLNRLLTAADGLERVDGVARVFGVPRATTIGDMLDVTRVMPKPVDDAGAAAVRTTVENNPLLNDRLVLGDGKVAMLYVQMDSMGDIDAQRDRILTAIDTVLADALKSGPKPATVQTAGIGVVYNALNVISTAEGAIFMGLAFSAIFLLLGPLFRSVAAVFVAVVAVSCSVVMTRGLYGLGGNDENMVTMTLPVLILILGIADCVHILRDFAAKQDAPRHKTLAAILRPCFFTTLTTMVGFLALATSKMAVVRALGIYGSAGIGLAFVCSAITCAFALSFPRFKVRAPRPPESGLFGRVLAATAQFSQQNKEAVIGATCLVILLCGYGVSRVEVDTYSLGFLATDHPVRADSEAMELAVGPFTPLEVVIRSTSDEAESIKSPAILRGAMAFELAAKARPDVRDAFGLPDVVARLHQINGGPGTPFEVPDNAEQVAANLELYGSDPSAQLTQLANPSWTEMRVTLSVPVLSAQGYASLLAEIETLAQKHLPETATVELSGYLPLYVKMMDYVVESQVSSFGLAFVLVFLLIGVLFRSLRMTALAVLPNVLPVFVTLGLMGFIGINLDVATVTITSIVMGIVVDDTIHYLHRFRAELERHRGNFEAACSAASIAVGRSIGATTVIFTLGFAILALASVKSIVYFGLLTAIAMVVALVGDLVVLPAILLTLKPDISRPDTAGPDDA